MKRKNRFVALLLVLSVALGMAGCKKDKQKEKEKEAAWYNSKTVDIKLPYNESEYNSLNSSFAGIIRNLAIVHVNYSKPYPNDFDYELDDPSPYQGDTLEIYDLNGTHLLTYDCRKYSPSFKGQISMSSEPSVAGDKVIIPWELYNEAGGSKSIITFIDPTTGELTGSFEKKLTGMYLRPGFVRSGGYSAFSYARYDDNASIELVIVGDDGSSRTINIKDSEILWNNAFPMADQGDGKILLPFMSTNVPDLQHNEYLQHFIYRWPGNTGWR